MSIIEGDVSMTVPDQDDWSPAVRNFPVAPGESFWTSDDGRTELQIGSVTARLDSETELDVLDLDYGSMRLALPQGSMDLRVWEAPRGGVLISTPAGPVRVDQPGIYRIDVGAVSDDGSYPPVEVTVLRGDASAGGPDGFADIPNGAAGLIYAGFDPDLVEASDASIDDWARAREASEHWTPRPDLPLGMTGFQDLEANGDFVDTPDYGMVWYPRNVPADWAPYRYGHWAYVEPWGYTWIDDQPWGFAPFHYGRWALINNRWAWAPGRPAAEPVYAPALVAFVGGSDWNISIGGGSGAAIGWVPLAPEEVYRPSYHVSEAYVRQVNVTSVRQTTINNITINNVTNITQYRNAPAATVVRAQSFSQGASVQKAVVSVSAAEIAHAPPPTSVNRPPPPAKTRAGAAAIAGGSMGAPRGAAPPAKLLAVRKAVSTQPVASTAPPVIAGVHIAPAKPVIAPGQKAVFVAPSQVRAPAAQGRQVVPTAHVPGPTKAASASLPTAIIPHPADVAPEPSGPMPQRRPKEPGYQEPQSALSGSRTPRPDQPGAGARPLGGSSPSAGPELKSNPLPAPTSVPSHPLGGLQPQPHPPIEQPVASPGEKGGPVSESTTAKPLATTSAQAKAAAEARAAAAKAKASKSPGVQTQQ